MPAGQPELFDGVHLDNGVGFLSPLERPSGFAAGRSRGLGVATEPALEGPSTGEIGELGMQVAELQPEVGRSPGGVLFVQEQSLLECWCGHWRGRVRVSRQQCRLARARKGLAEAANGTRG